LCKPGVSYDGGQQVAIVRLEPFEQELDKTGAIRRPALVAIALDLPPPGNSTL